MSGRQPLPPPGSDRSAAGSLGRAWGNGQDAWRSPCAAPKAQARWRRAPALLPAVHVDATGVIATRPSPCHRPFDAATATSSRPSHRTPRWRRGDLSLDGRLMCGLDIPRVTLAVRAAAFDFPSNSDTAPPRGWKLLSHPARRGLVAHLRGHFWTDLVLVDLATDPLKGRGPWSECRARAGARTAPGYMAAAPASATVWSCSIVPVETPIAPTMCPSRTSGIPPGNTTIRPPWASLRP